jgi:uncharacterized sporulation protein YeaH/YhbH (DUF444 family)
MEDEEMKRDNFALNDVDPDTSDEAEQAETEERVKAFAEKSKQEQMLMLFVNDLQIRRLARVIQMDRLKQKKAEEVRKTEGSQRSSHHHCRRFESTYARRRAPVATDCRRC